jgi:hypothetical protein
MHNIKVLSLAVFAESFLIGFLIFEADKAKDSGRGAHMQLTMVPLFSPINGHSSF